MAEVTVAVADSDRSTAIAGRGIALEASELLVANSGAVARLRQNIQRRAGSADVRLDQRIQLFDGIGDRIRLSVAAAMSVVAVEPRAVRFAVASDELHAEPAVDVIDH
ncbi:MAG: hypothetical protein FD138_4370 [Planctomycetota bacterium]|nr:MAG: hypothetical protein FD138_4370 [Planctomycetota bacterium]